MLQTSNHLQTNPTITIIQTKYLGFLIPVKSFSQQREKQFIVLFKVARQLLQQIFGHSRFWSPFTCTETFVPGNIIFHSHRPERRGDERRVAHLIHSRSARTTSCLAQQNPFVWLKQKLFSDSSCLSPRKVSRLRSSIQGEEMNWSPSTTQICSLGKTSSHLTYPQD